MATKSGRGKGNGNGSKLYYLYYLNGDDSWHLFESVREEAGQERLKDLLVSAMIAIKCRGAEKVLWVSLPASKKAPRKLPAKIGANPGKKDFQDTGINLCKKSVSSEF